MDPLHFTIIAVPLGVYFLLIGLISLQRKPFITTGSRDTATLAIALAGLVIAGPMELFFPESAAGRFGAWVWVLLIAFYGLCVSLLVLLMRPRIVVYNLGPERVRPILAELAMRLDPKARWSADSLLLPTLDVHLNLEGHAWLSNSQLVAVGNQQRMESWRMLERELRQQLAPIKSETVVFGVALFATASGLALISVWWSLARADAVREALVEMLRL